MILLFAAKSNKSANNFPYFSSLITKLTSDYNYLALNGKIKTGNLFLNKKACFKADSFKQYFTIQAKLRTARPHPQDLP